MKRENAEMGIRLSPLGMNSSGLGYGEVTNGDGRTTDMHHGSSRAHPAERGTPNADSSKHGLDEAGLTELGATERSYFAKNSSKAALVMRN